MIRTRGLVKRYGRLTAVDGIDLRIMPGEIYGFLGPNGAGKTSTIMMLLGISRPTAGEVSLFGEPFTASRLDLRRRIGVVPEKHPRGRLAVDDRRGVPCRCSPNFSACRMRRSASHSCWRRWIWARRATGASVSSPMGCCRSSASRALSCMTPTSFSSTSRYRAWTPSASSRRATCSCRRTARAAPYSSPAISSPRWRRSATGWPSSPAAGFLPRTRCRGFWPGSAKTARSTWSWRASLPTSPPRFPRCRSSGGCAPCPGSLVVSVAPEGDHRKAISELLIRRGLVPLRIEVKSPSLEDAFITITQDTVAALAPQEGR